MFRGYRAQQPAQQVSIDSSSQDQQQKQEWPHRHFYRAYSQEDEDAVAAIRAKYGLIRDEDAVRLALRLVAGDAVKVTVNASESKRVLVRMKKTVLKPIR